MGKENVRKCPGVCLGLFFVLLAVMVSGENHALSDAANDASVVIRTPTSDDVKAEHSHDDGKAEQNKPASSSKIHQPTPDHRSVKTDTEGKNPDLSVPSINPSKPKAETRTPLTPEAVETSTVPNSDTDASSEIALLPAAGSSSSASSPTVYVWTVTPSSFLLTSSKSTTSHKRGPTTPTATYTPSGSEQNVKVTERTVTQKAGREKASTSPSATEGSVVTSPAKGGNFRTERSSDQTVTSTDAPKSSKTTRTTSPQTTDNRAEKDAKESSTLVQTGEATMSTTSPILTHKTYEPTVRTSPSENDKLFSTNKQSLPRTTGNPAGEKLPTTPQTKSSSRETLTSSYTTMQTQPGDVTTLTVTETNTQETSPLSTSLSNEVTQAVAVTSSTTVTSSRETLTPSSTKQVTVATTTTTKSNTNGNAYTPTDGRTDKSTATPTERNNETTRETTLSTTMTPSTWRTTSQRVDTSSTLPSTTNDCLDSVRVDDLRIVDPKDQTTVTLTWRSLTLVSRVTRGFHVKVERRKRDDRCVVYKVQTDSDFKSSDNPEKQPRKREACEQMPEKLIPINGTVVIRDLKICTEYDVTVTPECASCTCGAFEVTTATVAFSTSSSVPGQVRSVQVDLNLTDSGSSVQVSWAPPAYPACGIRSYLLLLLLNFEGGACVREVLLMVKDDDDDRDKDIDWREQGNHGSVCKEQETSHGSLTSPQFVFRDLLPDTEYTLNVTAINDVGSGLPVTTYVHTPEAVPTAPTELRVGQMTSQSVTLMWRPPSPRPGATNYTVEVVDMGSPYRPLHRMQLFRSSQRLCATGYETSSCLVDNLRAHWRYRLSLTASTARGHSPPAVLPDPITTLSAAPGTVDKLNVERADDSFTAVKIKWNCPALRQRNSRITGFLVRSLLRLKQGWRNQTDDVKYLPTEDCDVTHSVDFQVVPEKLYFFEVLVLSESVNSTQWSTVSYLAPAGPSQPVSSLSLTAVESRNVMLQWSEPAVTNGHLTAYGVKVIMRDQAGPSCLRWTTLTLEKSYPSVQYQTKRNLTPWIDCKTHDAMTLAPENKSVTLTLHELPPDTALTLVVYPVNEGGWGLPANVSAHTEEAEPTAPRHISVDATNATTLVVGWTRPEPRPGATNYTVILHRATQLGSSVQTFFHPTTVTVTGWNSQRAVVPDLWSGWRYSVTLKSTTSKGSRTVQCSPIQMPQSPPGKVQLMSVRAVANDYRHVHVTWDYPALRDRNGVIVNFTLCSKRLRSQPGQCQTLRVEQPCQSRSPQFCATLHVTPGHNYTMMVAANNQFSGVPVTTTCVAKIGPPPTPVGVSVTSSVTMGNSQSTFNVTFCAPCLLNNTNGEITFIALLVCRDPVCQQVNRTARISRTYIDSLPSWNTAKGDNFRTLYRPTDDAWIDRVRALLESGVGPSANVRAEGVYTVGVDSDCGSADADVFCNGPLPAGQAFRVTTVTCTSASCAASDLSASVLTAKAEATDSVALTVVGCVLGLVLGIVVVVLFLCYHHRRQRRRSPKTKRSHRRCRQEIERELTDMTHTHSRGVTIQGYGDKYREWKSELDDDTGFPSALVQQFAEIREHSPQYSQTAARLEENKAKNRYTNILPFDHTRVKLVQMDDDVTTDYINANYIPGYHGKREYIASQGPLHSTVEDFWRMVWYHKCPVIVMLSALTEGRLNKVHQYYPDDDQLNAPVTYGMVTVTLQNVDPHKDYVVRTFRLNVDRGQHEVRQFFVDSWKDFKANLTPSLVLNFVRAVREQVPANTSHPLLVHCSAGVGRTGTWIAIDYFMHYVRHSPLSAPLNIRDFVLTMRHCRVHMVQSLEQYLFIHEVVAELVRRKTEVDRYDEPVYDNQLAYATVAYEQDGDGPDSSTETSTDSSDRSNNHHHHHHHHSHSPQAPYTTTPDAPDATLPPPSPCFSSDVIGVMTSRM